MKSVTLKEEYDKNKNIKPEDVQMLTKWMGEQDHLPKITELEALIFLSGQNGDQELTQKKIEVYYSSRARLDEFFKDRNPEILGEHMNVALYAGLELPRQYDRSIFCRIMDTNPSKLNVAEQVKIVGMVSDLWILKEGSAPGYQYIVDATGSQMGHMLKMRLGTLKNAIFVLQETLPINVTHIHFINVLPVVEKIFNLVKPFIKSYLLKKIIFHTNGIESLFQYLPKQYVPKNVGGDGTTLEELHEKMKQTLLQNKDYFRQEELTKRADESKRKKEERPNNWKNIFSGST